MKAPVLVAAVIFVATVGGASASPDFDAHQSSVRWTPASATPPTDAQVTRSYTDSRGEDAAAADIIDAVLESDASGNVRLTIRIAKLAELTDETVLFVALDVDRNTTTGDHDGVDVLFQMDRTGAKLQRWDGARFAPLDNPPVEASYAAGTLVATLPLGRLGSRTAFDFGIVTVRGTGAAMHFDSAPNSGRWTFAFRNAPARPRALKATFTPKRPVSGRRFAVRRVTLVLTNGARRSATARCAASITGKRLAQKRRCSWVIPAAACQRVLIVAVTGTDGNFRLARTFRLKIR